MESLPADRADRRYRRFRRSCVMSGIYLALLPGAILLFGPTTANLTGVYELWGICVAVGAFLVIVGVAARPGPGARDRPFYGK